MKSRSGFSPTIPPFVLWTILSFCVIACLPFHESKSGRYPLAADYRIYGLSHPEEQVQLALHITISLVFAGGVEWMRRRFKKMPEALADKDETHKVG